MKYRQIFVTTLFVASAMAAAQQPGSTQYNQVFLPAHGVGDTTPRREQRAPSWAAFATSPATGRFGSAIEKATENEAEREALVQCARKGDLDCEVMFTFDNYCAAVASGGRGGASYATHSSLDQAVDNALAECSFEQCEIFFKECSYGERIQ